VIPASRASEFRFAIVSNIALRSISGVKFFACTSGSLERYSAKAHSESASPRGLDEIDPVRCAQIFNTTYQCYLGAREKVRLRAKLANSA
jgi:hypothetical protein